MQRRRQLRCLLHVRRGLDALRKRNRQWRGRGQGARREVSPVLHWSGKCGGRKAAARFAAPPSRSHTRRRLQRAIGAPRFAERLSISLVTLSNRNPSLWTAGFVDLQDGSKSLRGKPKEVKRFRSTAASCMPASGRTS